MSSRPPLCGARCSPSLSTPTWGASSSSRASSPSAGSCRSAPRRGEQQSVPSSLSVSRVKAVQRPGLRRVCAQLPHSLGFVDIPGLWLLGEARLHGGHRWPLSLVSQLTVNLTGTCTIVTGVGGDSFSYFYRIFIPTFPYCVISYCYLKIISIVRNIHGAVVRHQTTAKVQHRDQEVNLTITIGAILVSYVVCNLPANLILILDPTASLYTDLHLPCYVLAWLSSIVKVCVYVAFNQAFRTAFKNILCSSPQTRCFLFK